MLTSKGTLMKCRKHGKSIICVPEGATEGMICRPRLKGKTGRKLPPKLRAWNTKVKRYRLEHGVSLKEAMQALKNQN
jgi:hypothetical protein